MKSLQAFAVGLLILVAVGLALLLLEAKRAAPDKEIEDRLETILREVARIRSEIAALKTGEMSVEQREAILSIIAEDRLREALRHEENTSKRGELITRWRADQAARKYDLTSDQRQRLTDLMLAEDNKMHELGRQFLDPSRPGDPEGLRSATEAWATWRRDELTKMLGPELGQRVDLDVFSVTRRN